MLARSVEQHGEKRRCAANLLLHPEILERQHDRCAVLPHPPRQRLDLRGGMRRAVNHNVIEREVKLLKSSQPRREQPIYKKK